MDFIIKTNNRKLNKMKTNTLFAIILIAMGIAFFGYQGITYTTREKVVDLGPIQIEADKKHTIPLLPIVGGIMLVGGIAVLVGNTKRT